jgi:polyhydroxyalkanoate synthesis regulator phasin
MVRREEMRAMQDAWRAYLDLALGATETSRKKATKVAKKLLGRGNATAEQLQTMAEDLVTSSKANREALTRLVRFELERALGRVGLATAEEVSALTTRVKELEQELEEAKNGRSRATTPAPVEPLAPPLVKKAEPPVANKAVAKKTVAKKVAVVPAQPEPEPVVVAAAPTPAAKKAPVRKATTTAVTAPAKKAVAKKAAPVKAPAKKAVATKATPVKAAPTGGQP